MVDCAPALSCKALSAGWGETQVVSNVSLAVPTGEILMLLGRNGVGKSTLLAAIVGRATRLSGHVFVGGSPVDKLPIYERALLGVGYVPQEREIFSSLSVQENLLIAAQPSRRAATSWTLPRVVDLFPRLGERLRNSGRELSGGEQQMLSIGRALMGNPSVLLLDEPMEGLAPVIIDQLLAALHRIRQESAMAILMVEQHIDLALEFSSRVIVLDRGEMVYDNADGAAAPDRSRIEALAGVSGQS